MKHRAVIFTDHFKKYACPGDTITAQSGDLTLTATIHHDHDHGPPDKEQDGYWPSLDPNDAGYIGKKSKQTLARHMAKAKAALEAWNRNEWFYCGISVTVTKDDVQLVEPFHAACWGIECNHPHTRSNDYLQEVANQLAHEAIWAAEDKLKSLGKRPALQGPWPKPSEGTDEAQELIERADLFELMDHHLEEETELGDSSPIDNVIRAAFAAEALTTFTSRCMGGSDPRDMHHGDLGDSLGDLVGDLLHLARLLGFDVDEILQQARGHYDYEVTHERIDGEVA